MMTQFSVYRNQYGNLNIYCINPKTGLMRQVALRQFNRETGRYD